MGYIYVFLIGIIGFLILYIIKIPTAALLGPLFLIVIFNILGLEYLDFPSWIYFILQSILGAFIGFSVNKNNIKQMKKLFFPSIIVIIWTFFITFGLGFLIMKLENLDKFTAFLSTSPGGITEISVLAISVGADITIVTLLQLSRLITTISLVPFVAKKYSKKIKQTSYLEDVKNRIIAIHNNILNLRSIINNSRISNFKYIITIFIALIGGIIGQYAGIPGGALIGSFLIISLASIMFSKLPIIPRFYKTIILIGVGTSIGINITKNKNVNISDYFFILFVFIIVFFSTAYLMSRLIKRITDWDDLSCILASAPGGLTTITILAYENESRVLEVSIMQLTRLLTVKLVIWPIILFII